ncbi:sugar phosphate isomerase/epimerase [Pedobacter metabolipauper]|uniref:Sugar phosphate isomerase/epimerase n=1 Tax=Pedobacter metabolipauper TaxID=425513 RepID=A0A4R6SPT1_9SPHI|nr:sugar phosphate isomerase/epimerase [Pedobacter metabolipauper]TDQ06627.1 sugar phosphate isomerase/epimerase [Pedobacter metabolipauper]
MKVKILSPLWGHEHLPMKEFLDQIKDAGYDGVDTWIPELISDRRILFNYLQQHNLDIVTHQHSACGSTFKAFKLSFIKNLHACAEPGPILINSHTGKDYFSLSQNIELLDAAQEFTEKTGILVTHETHRGRLGYSPQMMETIFQLRKDIPITADLSHWVCVTESMLENFKAAVDKTLSRSRHIHARIGFEQGPQVPDPRAPEWEYALNKFLSWWDEIIHINASRNCDVLPVTTEFGPPPYMPVIPFTNLPVASQFEINCFMKDLLAQRYQQYRSPN